MSPASGEGQVLDEEMNEGGRGWVQGLAESLFYLFLLFPVVS